MTATSAPELPEGHAQAGTVMRVSTTTDPGSVAGAISHVIRRDGEAELSVIGAGALNQAVKAIAIAVSFLAEEGLPIAMVPSFRMIDLDGNERTSLHLKVVRLPT